MMTERRAEMERLTHERRNGYWSPNKKQELVDRLAAYENTDLDPEQVEHVKETAKKYLLEKAQGKAGGWIPVEERLPDEYDGLVLVQVSGKPRKNITLNNALQLACYISEAGEGWIVEEYPEWENPNVIAWRPLPEPYRPERSRK